ncbi:39S ribosomal protein L34, mitochondrial [Callorhinchus milii]|uniref:Large ribosomal subunit protein bL34m n=1 Tax=Callorhinchus milii TaxID=7868 RepID=V9LJP9_CALMI|nr:39S ribosomal protein L34, mitochondrial [Callorhinchus milii]|eukprot:gi/632961870/ref/XP_007896999.1/ PREDICTED: 39S ribosomal protein L34, mitochondrial [Callorhinchus milii]
MAAVCRYLLTRPPAPASSFSSSLRAVCGSALFRPSVASRADLPTSAGLLQRLTGQLSPWFPQQQQVRTRKRGTEYQPKNIKRKRTHGWMKRISTRGGIEVILRRMLKGRNSLTH